MPFIADFFGVKCFIVFVIASLIILVCGLIVDYKASKWDEQYWNTDFENPYKRR